ncbi:hypothetical protein [Cupriavidus sp. GA3-3]|uniref:hypothetical protein n=1 Tax=Cupriavidus sp. GA3-3 TaxID=1229514 RepID=UPI001183E744|nr:hypothetical protein [Cupriavidus sp. GA3-3]
MFDLLARTTCADNADQFARWFDQTMSERHPLVDWGTERSRKWRRNFRGDAALTRESLDLLHELFPDDRYYAAVTAPRGLRPVARAYAVLSQQPKYGREYLPYLGVTELFWQGPANLWTALWGHEHAAERLWDLLPLAGEYDGTWGPTADFEVVVTDLEMRLYGNYDCGLATTIEDLSRALVLYRLKGHARGFLAEHGLRAYLCVRLALAGLHPLLRAWGIFDDLSSYIVGLEQERISSDRRHRQAIQHAYRPHGPFNVGMFVENPFLHLLEWRPQQARRYAALALYSAYK